MMFGADCGVESRVLSINYYSEGAALKNLSNWID